MSVIESFFDTTVTGSRVTGVNPTGSDITTASGVFLGTFAVETELDQLYFTNDLGKEYDFYTYTDSDIKKGDTLVTGADTYDTKAVSVYTDREGDVESYLKARVVKI